MKKNSFVIYTDCFEQIEAIPDADRGILFLEVVRYARTGTMPTFANPLMYAIFLGFKNQIDRDGAKYDEVCKKRAEAGKRGGLKKAENLKLMDDVANVANATNCYQMQAKASKSKQTLANVADNDSDNDSDNDNDNIISSKEECKSKLFPKVDFERIINMYHNICISFPRIMKMSDERKRKVEIRFVEEMKSDYSLLENVFKKMEESKFLRGDNSRGWKATFDWLFANAKNWVKVAEGNYDNRDEKPMKGVINKDCNDEWGNPGNVASSNKTTNNEESW